MALSTFTTMGEVTTAGAKRKTTPPNGYVCNLCGVSGHWIQQCTEKPSKRQKKKKKTSDHVPVAGVDPSENDIEKAREMQKIKPPSCFCGITSRLKKVKRSKVGGSESRAIGKYFFFCSKGVADESKCRFARPVEDELKPKKERLCTFFAKTGNCKKGDRCIFSHDLGTSSIPVPLSAAAKTNKVQSSQFNSDDLETSRPQSEDEKFNNDTQKKHDHGSSASSSSSDSDSSDSSSSNDSDEDYDQQF